MTYRVTTRDRIAFWISNFALERIAAKQYRAFVSVLLVKGKVALDEELGA